MFDTAAIAEDRADERGHRDHVVDVERLAAGERKEVGPVLGVDPVGVVRHVAEHLLALRTVGAHELLALRLTRASDSRLGSNGVALVTSENASRPGMSSTAARPARGRAEQEPAIAGHHPTCAEHHAGARRR